MHPIHLSLLFLLPCGIKNSVLLYIPFSYHCLRHFKHLASRLATSYTAQPQPCLSPLLYPHPWICTSTIKKKNTQSLQPDSSSSTFTMSASTSSCLTYSIPVTLALLLLLEHIKYSPSSAPPPLSQISTWSAPLTSLRAVSPNVT